MQRGSIGARRGPARAGRELGLPILAAPLLALAFAAGPSAIVAAPPARQELRDTLKQMWDSLDSVSFRCEEQTIDGSGRPRVDLGLSRYEITFASQGRRSFLLTAVRPRGEEVIENWRADGRRTYAVVPKVGVPGAMDRAVISNQQDPPDHYTLRG